MAGRLRCWQTLGRPEPRRQQQQQQQQQQQRHLLAGNIFCLKYELLNLTLKQNIVKIISVKIE